MSLLQTYSGRDKILRTISYLGTLLSGSVKNEETAQKLVTVSREISNTRVVLRFFDDILMWRITKHWSVEVYYVSILSDFHLCLFASSVLIYKFKSLYVFAGELVCY